MSKILVTGATGNVGSQVVELLKEIANVRVGAYDVEAAINMLGEDLDIVHFDFLKPETFAGAFKGVDRLFLVRPPAISNIDRDVAPAIRAAVDAGVKHIVFLSVQGVEKNRFIPHFKIETLLRELTVDWTFLRASFFMQNLSTTHRQEIQERDEIIIPVGKAKTSFIDVRDIAAVAVATLTQPGHAHKAYTLTGSQALDYDQVAKMMSEVLGRPIRYTKPSLWRFYRFQRSRGQAFGYTLVVMMLYTITRLGNAKQITADVSHILQRDPIPFRQYLIDYQDLWHRSRFERPGERLRT